jgi:hypothetical protein
MQVVTVVVPVVQLTRAVVALVKLLDMLLNGMQFHSLWYQYRLLLFFWSCLLLVTH